MGIGKDKLTYDPTDANSLAASDTIGSHTLDGAGTAITSTLVSGKQGLDVNVISEINVDLNGIYDGTTNPTPDNVGIVAYTRASSPGLTGQVQLPTSAAASSDGVVAANAHGLDVNGFGMVYNGTTWDRMTGTSGAVDINIKSQSLGTVAVSGTVTANAGSGTFTVSDAALANTAVKSTATSVTNTAAVILASQLSNRKYLSFQNLGSAAVFVGDSSVTASTGIRLSNGAMLESLRLGPAISLKAVTAGGTGDLRILEAS